VFARRPEIFFPHIKVRSMLRVCVILATAGAAAAFAPATGHLALRSASRRISSSNVAMNGAQKSREGLGSSSASQITFSRKEAVSAFAAGAALIFSELPAYSEDKAACTYANCPAPPADASYELSLFQVHE
jgi:hypothetical protein